MSEPKGDPPAVELTLPLPCPIERIEAATKLLRDMYGDPTIELDWSVDGVRLTIRVRG